MTAASSAQFLISIKESAERMKRQLASIYKQADSSASDGESQGSDGSASRTRPGLVKARSRNGMKELEGEHLEDHAGSEDSAEGLQDDSDDDDFLQFAMKDLLADGGEFNLEICKAQVDTLLSKFKVDSRVEFAKDMDQWMELVSKLHDRSEDMMNAAEAAHEDAATGLEERRGDISTLVGQNSVKIIKSMRDFMDNITRYRTETLQALKAKHSQSVWDQFWEGLQGSAEKVQQARRTKVIFEEEVAANGSPHGTVKGKPGSKEEEEKEEEEKQFVMPQTVASQMLETISGQQDEIAYLRTRVEIESAKMKRSKSVLNYVRKQKAEEAGKALPEGGAELLAEVRGRLRQVAFDSILATEEGRTLVRRAGGEQVRDLEAQSQLQEECARLTEKGKTLEAELAKTLSPEDRIKDLEKQIEFKRSQKDKAALKAERKARQAKSTEEGGLEDLNVLDVPLKASEDSETIQQLKDMFPSIESSLEEVQKASHILSEALSAAKEKALATMQENGGTGSDLNTVKAKVEEWQQKLVETKHETKELLDENTRLQKSLKNATLLKDMDALKEDTPGKNSKGRGSLTQGRGSLTQSQKEPPNADENHPVSGRHGKKKHPAEAAGSPTGKGARLIGKGGIGDAGTDSALNDMQVAADTEGMVMFDDSGKPTLEDKVGPDPSGMVDIERSREYLGSLTQACEMLESQQAQLEAKLEALTASADEEKERHRQEEHDVGGEVQAEVHGKTAGESVSSNDREAPVSGRVANGATARGNGGDARSAKDARSGGGGAADLVPEGVGEAANAGANVKSGSRTGADGKLGKEAKAQKGMQLEGSVQNPSEALPEPISKEVQAGVQDILKMFVDMEELQSQTREVEARIHQAKIGAVVGKVASEVGSSAAGKIHEDVDDAPDENKALRREVHRKQRELNQLRKRWMAEKNKKEQNAARQQAYVEPAARLVLQHPPEISQAKEEAGSDDRASPFSASSSASDTTSRPSTLNSKRGGIEDGAGREKDEQERLEEKSREQPDEANRSEEKSVALASAVKRVTLSVQFNETEDDEQKDLLEGKEDKAKQKIAPQPSKLARLRRTSGDAQTDSNMEAEKRPSIGVAGRTIKVLRNEPRSDSESDSSPSSASSSSGQLTASLSPAPRDRAPKARPTAIATAALQRLSLAVTVADRLKTEVATRKAPDDVGQDDSSELQAPSSTKPA